MYKFKFGKKLGQEFERTFDSRSLMRELSRMMEFRTVRKWEVRGSGRSYDGIQWDQLSESTANKKIYVTPPSLGGKKKARGKGRRRGHKHMLQDTGEMLNALTNRVIGKKESRVFFLPPNAQKYFWHHFGLGRLPARVVLDVSTRDKKAIDRIVELRVNEVLEKTFSGG